MKNFIRNIDLVDSRTWKEKLFVTIDIDWVNDDVLQDTIDLLEKNNVNATIFVTHESAYIKQLANNPNFELGIHPNFNFLLNGDFRYGKNYKEVIDYYFQMVPNAKSFRSHSLTLNSGILDYAFSKGITHECNLFIPYQSNISVRPFKHWDNSSLRVPHCFEDDVALMNPVEMRKGIFKDLKAELIVVDFHPIHIFLNSCDNNTYALAKPHLGDTTMLRNFVNKEKPGIRDLFEEILIRIKSK